MSEATTQPSLLVARGTALAARGAARVALATRGAARVALATRGAARVALATRGAARAALATRGAARASLAGRETVLRCLLDRNPVSLGQLLAACHQVLETLARTEAGHGGLLDPDAFTGLRVAGVAGGSIHLLEGAEPGDRYPITSDHGTDDGIQYIVDRICGLLTASHLVRNRFDQLCLVHGFPFSVCFWSELANLLMMVVVNLLNLLTITFILHYINKGIQYKYYENAFGDEVKQKFKTIEKTAIIIFYCGFSLYIFLSRRITRFAH